MAKAPAVIIRLSLRVIRISLSSVRDPRPPGRRGFFTVDLIEPLMDT
jgi:hypothetical protein